jgi:hypothetical protein
MVLVYLKTGECVQVEHADATRYEADYLVCVDHFSGEVARFDLADVLSFTVDSKIAAMMLQDECRKVELRDGAGKATASGNAQ